MGGGLGNSFRRSKPAVVEAKAARVAGKAGDLGCDDERKAAADPVEARQDDADKGRRPPMATLDNETPGRHRLEPRFPVVRKGLLQALQPRLQPDVEHILQSAAEAGRNEVAVARQLAEKADPVGLRGGRCRRLAKGGPLVHVRPIRIASGRQTRTAPPAGMD